MAVAAYQLKSDLARACLPAPDRSAWQRLAWVNSLCILFLLVGVFGAQSRVAPLKRPPPPDQPVPVIIEPLPATPPAADQKETAQNNDDEKQDAPRVVAVTLDTPSINFAVPTIGNLLVPISAAPTPPPAELRRAAPAPRAPVAIQSTGEGGDRPDPTYPEMAQQLGQQGTVVLLLTVDDVGAVTSISVKETSGSAILDQSAMKWIKRHWIVPPSNGGHLFLVPISYKLKTE
ncbi:MAG: TonB family protein [Verrucomicrobiota bacterium]|jgi:protein TonB